jgi:exosome complex component RRP46
MNERPSTAHLTLSFLRLLTLGVDMAVVSEPLAHLSHLPRTDGSARYSHGGYTVTASVNGPVEAGRRDEDPYEAVVDVVLRPAAGTGGEI